MRTLRAAQFAEDSGPLAHPVRPRAYREINNFYTPTVYEKGAELIRMLRLIIGDEAFRAGMDLYFSRCDGMAATIEDFLACFAETSGRDLTHFARWYEQAGTPVVTVETRFEPRPARDHRPVADDPADAGQPDKQPLVIPVALALVDPMPDHRPGPRNSTWSSSTVLVAADLSGSAVAPGSVAVPGIFRSGADRAGSPRFRPPVAVRP